MKIVVKYTRFMKTFDLPDDATVAALKEELSKEFKVSPELQKIVFKGKNLTESDKKLSEYGIRNNTKVFLVASESEKTEIQEKSAPKETNLLPSMYNSTHPPSPDQTIVQLGAPTGVLKNFQTDVASLPQEPFIVRTAKGIAKLQIETDALFVQYIGGDADGQCDRIFSFDIKAYSTEQISKNDYFHLCIQTPKGPFIFYFLPNQYKNVISRLVGNMMR